MIVTAVSFFPVINVVTSSVLQHIENMCTPYCTGMPSQGENNRESWLNIKRMSLSPKSQY